ncbi:MAG: hypothetical protein ACI9SJ_000174 [Flavobacteriaceae bacterium]|jgi:hypothetical protein|uniref:hypothetical protein n=1 Tax=Candidatus Marifrigoribacter sp. Uisw_064 TaxID=3230970 RepID=UPI003AE2D7EE
MKNTLLLGVIISILFIQCGKETDLFLIQKGAVGNLTHKNAMKQIDSIFSNDSIVKLNPIKNAIGTQGDVEIYEKGGAKLMLLSPNDESDPESMITNIQIFDNRYKTIKGLNSESTFKVVKDNYIIADIETTISSVVVFLEDSEIYLTIDKKELPEDLRYNSSLKIESSQIPDKAVFKYFMIGWDYEDEEVESQE